MSSAREAMNAAVSDPEDAKWRVNLREKVDKIRKRALVDYVERRDSYNCDAAEVVRYVEEESEGFERERISIGLRNFRTRSPYVFSFTNCALNSRKTNGAKITASTEKNRPNAALGVSGFVSRGA